MGQLGFFDLNRRYESLTEKNDPLVPGETTLTPLILVRVQVAQPVITYLISHYYCLSWKPIFSRICGVTCLVLKAICGRDGCTRDFGRGRYENLASDEAALFQRLKGKGYGSRVDVSASCPLIV